jgi:hypothetical protein
MSGMAIDFRHQADQAEDPERRAFLLELSDYCRRMALAMQRRLTQASPAVPLHGAGSSAKVSARPTLASIADDRE